MFASSSVSQPILNAIWQMQLCRYANANLLIRKRMAPLKCRVRKLRGSAAARADVKNFCHQQQKMVAAWSWYMSEAGYRRAEDELRADVMQDLKEEMGRFGLGSSMIGEATNRPTSDAS